MALHISLCSLTDLADLSTLMILHNLLGHIVLQHRSQITIFSETEIQSLEVSSVFSKNKFDVTCYYGKTFMTDVLNPFLIGHSYSCNDKSHSNSHC